jgi:predicted TIM-barrel fold metal-dependent hydrolase
MTKRFLIFTVISLIALAAVAAFSQSQPAQPNPRTEKFKPSADYHQHLFSPEMAAFQKIQPVTAQAVIALLDAAGINRAVLLSTAYAYGRPGREPQDEYTRVKAENDWVGAQAALYPKRLIAFCGFNPLKDYALEEMARCAKDPNLKRGIKMHFGNSDVQLENPAHIEKLKAVFREANARRMAIVIHLRASISLNRPYGPEQARAFIEQLLPLAPDITVQVAHMAGSGPGYHDPKAESVFEVLADAVAKGDKRTKNLWFDITTSAHPSNTPEDSARLLRNIRRLGVKRLLYGTDVAISGNLEPRDSWEAFCRLDLTDKEIKTVAKNVAPYLR